nr:hypothetical protein [Streptomyces angustmyceticus]
MTNGHVRGSDRRSPPGLAAGERPAAQAEPATGRRCR